jgi:hypothetical protein
MIYGPVDAGKSPEENLANLQAAGHPIQCGPGNFAPQCADLSGPKVTYDPSYPAPADYPGAVPGMPSSAASIAALASQQAIPMNAPSITALPVGTDLTSQPVSAFSVGAPAIVPAGSGISLPTSLSSVPWYYWAGGALAVWFLFLRGK